MSTNTPERFREVEPFRFGPHEWLARGGSVYVEIDHVYLLVPEVRALRDWLNKALPEEKP